MEISNSARSIQTQRMQRNTLVKSQPAETPEDNFTFSDTNSGLNRLGKGIGGAIAGTAFSGLLLSLPLSLAPALGVETQAALSTYKAAVLTLGAIGGVASAAMPEGKNWY